MTTTTITEGRPFATFINVFAVEPAQQQDLVEALVRFTQEVARRQPGFISANIHRSLDGLRVTNYIQWERPEDLQAMLALPEAAPHLKECQALSTSIDLHPYEVSHIAGPSQRERETEASTC